MKKNRIMRLASALLVLTLVTTCAISNTFAKYVTSTTGSDKARVAYWGFNQAAATNIDLFSTSYTTGDDNTENVKSANTDKVIAPGTEKSTTFAFGYDVNATASDIKAPEVAYKFTVEVTPSGTYTDLDSNPNFKWTLKGPNDTTAKEYGTVAELKTAIETLSGDPSGSKEYKPGELPTAFTAADETYTVGWKWAYETTDTDGTANATQDATDTAMGNAADLENVNLTITITATQID